MQNGEPIKASRNTHTTMKTDIIDGHGQSAVHNPSELIEALQAVFNDWTSLVGEDLRENNEDVQRIWKACESALSNSEKHPVTYFATDGNYGPCSGMILANTMPWSLDDWQDIDEASDDERVEVAEKIAAKYQ
jgi:hypothetical protein